MHYRVQRILTVISDHVTVYIGFIAYLSAGDDAAELLELSMSISEIE